LVLMIAGFAAAGLWLGQTVGGVMKRGGSASAVSIWHLVAFLPVTLLVIGWHELGHVVGGWYSGFRLMLFAVGPLKIERVWGRLQVRFNRSPQMWGGLAATAPLDGVARDAAFMRWALVRIVAGGPLFSLLGAAGAGAVLLFVNWQTQAGLLIAMVGVMSLLIGVVTLMPLSTGGYRSDGARLLQMLRGGAEADRWANLSILSGLAMTSRPRDWPGDLVAASCQEGNSGFDAISGFWMRALYHIDRNEYDEAARWIGQALEREQDWPKPARALLHASAAYIFAMQGDASGARKQWMETTGGGFHMKEHLLLAEAAVLLVEQRWAEASDVAARGLALLPPGISGMDQATREALVSIAAQATAASLK
jgi:hypothetical protein